MVHRFSYLLYQVLGIYMIFGSMLVKSIFGIVASKFMLLIFLTLLICCFVCGGEAWPRKGRKIFLLLFILYIIFVGLSLIGTPLESSNTGLVAYIQYLYLPFYIYIFLNYSVATKRKIEVYFRFIINIAVIWVFANFFFYYVELPIWENYQQWVGRISVGYPTVDAVCLSYALMLILFIEDLGIGKVRRLLSTIIIIIGIISQFSGTGTALLFVIFAGFIVSSYKSGHISLKYNFYTSIVTVAIMLTTGFGYFYSKNQELTEYAMSLITKKISFFVGDDAIESDWNYYSWDDTMETRSDQYGRVKNTRLKSLTDKVFGIGFRDVTVYSSGYSKKIFIENQYGINLVTIGYIGSVLFVLFVIEPLKRWIKHYYRRKDILTLFVGVLAVIFFLLSSFTTLTLVTYQIELLFALFYAIILRPGKQLKIQR